MKMSWSATGHHTISIMRYLQDNIHPSHGRHIHVQFFADMVSYFGSFGLSCLCAIELPGWMEKLMMWCQWLLSASCVCTRRLWWNTIIVSGCCSIRWIPNPMQMRTGCTNLHCCLSGFGCTFDKFIESIQCRSQWKFVFYSEDSISLVKLRTSTTRVTIYWLCLLKWCTLTLTLQEKWHI